MLSELLFGRNNGTRNGRLGRNVTYGDLINSVGGGYSTESGVSVNAKGSMKYGPVWQAVSLISGDIAKLPFEVYRKEPSPFGDQGMRTPVREKDTDHPAYNAIRHEPNEETSAFDFWRTVMVHVLLYGNAYARILDGPDGTELYLLLPDRTAPERLTEKGMLAKGFGSELANQLDGQLVYTTELSGKLLTYDKSEILHFKGVSLNGVEGLDVTKHAKDAIALGLIRQKFESKFFKNGSRVSGTLEVPASFTKKAKDNLEQGFEKKYSNADNWFRVVVLRDGAKFHQTSVSPQDAQLVEGNEAQVRAVARFFNLHPSRLGLADSQGLGSQVESNQRYLDNTLSPWLSMIVSECRKKLFTREEKLRNRKYFEHNTDQLLRLDPAKRHGAYASGIKNRYLSPNEVRAKENLPPYEGGDDFLPMPGQFPRGDQPGGEDKDPDPEPNDDDPPPSDGDDETDEEDDEGGSRSWLKDPAAAARMVYHIGQRARHKANKPNAFIEWVDSDLRSHREEARTLLGVDEPFDEVYLNPIVEQLRQVVEQATNDDLADRVDATMFRFELQASKCFSSEQKEQSE